MSGEIKEDTRHGRRINYYVIAALVIGILVFQIGNSITPDIEESLDEYEFTTSVGFAAACIFAFIIAKRYWGSKVFGKTYLALAIGYLFYNIGWNLWWFYEIWYEVDNPYVALPDVFFIAFYPFAIYHIRKNYLHFKPSLSKSQKLIIITIPIICCAVYIFSGLLQVSADGGFSNIQISALPTYDEEGWNGFFTGLIFTFASSLTFSSAIVAAQIFRTTVLGAAWGLLLLGILLNTSADIYYYINENFGGYVRSEPYTAIWLAGTVFLCYGLYIHRKEI